MLDKQSFEIDGLDFVVSMPVFFITVLARQQYIDNSEAFWLGVCSLSKINTSQVPKASKIGSGE